MSIDRRLLLALGDLACFVAFGALGLSSHEDAVTLTTIARAILVFPAAWFLIAPWFGAFSADAVNGHESLRRLALIWLTAGVVALCGRALIFDRALLNAFFPIALIGNGILLLAWRAVYSTRLARRTSPATG
ncbi:MAG: DUF3054 domain-containing protein [Chloroflexota bacterium]